MLSASDFNVKGTLQTRESVEKKDFDGFVCDLEEGDKLSWYVTLVSGDVFNLYVMSGEEYQKMGTSGSSPVYFSQLSKEKVDFDQNEIVGQANYLGELVVVITTQGTENSSSVYDIEIKVKKVEGPKSFIDQVCGLGAGICAILVIGGVVVVAIVYYIFKKFMPVTERDVIGPEDRGQVSSVDGMMRPGFDVVIGPAAEPPRPKKLPTKWKGTKNRTRTKPQKPKSVVGRKPPVRNIRPGYCPKCGERADEAAGFCPTCGSDL